MVCPLASFLRLHHGNANARRPALHPHEQQRLHLMHQNAASCGRRTKSTLIGTSYTTWGERRKEGKWTENGKKRGRGVVCPTAFRPSGLSLRPREPFKQNWTTVGSVSGLEPIVLIGTAVMWHSAYPMIQCRRWKKRVREPHFSPGPIPAIGHSLRRRMPDSTGLRRQKTCDTSPRLHRNPWEQAYSHRASHGQLVTAELLWLPVAAEAEA